MNEPALLDGRVQAAVSRSSLRTLRRHWPGVVPDQRRNVRMNGVTAA